MNLFAANAPWAEVAGRTSVFEMYGFGLAGSLAGIRQQVNALKARGILISTQVEALTSKSCGQGVEGFGGDPEADLATIRRIAAAGGTVSFISMDEPFYFASLYDGPNACHWSATKVAQEVTAYVKAIHAEFPAIQIGDIEPWPAGSWSDYTRWLTAYRTVSGSAFPYLHLDLDPHAAPTGWPDQVHAIQKAVDAQGIRFGILYVGGGETTDAAWLQRAQETVLAYELDGGPPDDAVFESWEDKPDWVLPESKPNTFTHLIVDYTRKRTALSMQAAPGAGQPAETGRVTTLGGEPVAGAVVDVTATPRDGPYQVLELRGTVPAGVSEAVIGVRANMEDAGPGPADLTFYELGYTEGEGTTNLVPKPQIGDGLDRWGRCDDGNLTPSPSDRGTGQMLHIVLTPEQTLCINSATFPVTPGSDYRMWVAARIPETSIGSAYVAAIFLGGSSAEGRRDILPLAPTPLDVGTATTGATGAFSATAATLEAGRYHLRATYWGNATYWPAGPATVDVAVP
jgi:hypothetical protein